MLAFAASFALLAISCSKLGDPIVEPDPVIPPAGSGVPVLSPRADTTIREGELLVVRFPATDPKSLGLVYVVEGPGTATGDEWGWRPDFTQSGTHSVRVIVRVQGHPEWADTLAFAVIVLDETQPGPRINTVRDTAIHEDRLFSLVLSATDPRNLGVTWSMTGPPGATLTGTTFTWTPTFSQAGVYDAVFRVADKGVPARRDSLRVRITVLDVDRPPVLEALRDTTVDTTSTLQFTLSATDPDGDAVTYAMPGRPTGSSLNGAVFRWKPRASQAGSVTLRVIATAKGLSDTDNVAVTVQLAPILPPVDSAAVVPAPLAYWSFEEGAGSLVRDSAAGGRHVILYGSPAWVNGVSGKGVRFSGATGQYGLSNATLPDMTEQTMTGWIYLDAIKYMTLIGESDFASAHDNELSLEYSTGTPRWMYRTKDLDPKGLHYAAGTAPTAGKWYFLAGTSKGDTARIYVNGVLARTDTHAQPFNLSGYHGAIEISRKNGYAYGVQGIVDEIKVYNKALTAKQVQTEWNRHKTAAGY